MRRLLAAIATAMLFAVLVAPSALASPNVVDSDPANGAEEHEAPDTVTISFDMPLADDSIIKVVDECGRQIDAQNTTVQLNEMSVDLAEKPSGHYKAFYYANPPAGATGSTNGYIEFHVHMGPSCGPEATAHHHGGSDHEGHGGHEGHEGSGHEGHDDHSTHADHSAHSDHSDHSAHLSAGHAGHTHAAGTNHAGHGGAAGGHHHHDGGSNGGVSAAGTNPAPRAAGPGGSQLSDAQAVLISLGACLLLGVAGGWMVRTTQAPRRTA